MYFWWSYQKINMKFLIFSEHVAYRYVALIMNQFWWCISENHKRYHKCLLLLYYRKKRGGKEKKEETVYIYIYIYVRRKKNEELKRIKYKEEI